MLLAAAIAVLGVVPFAGSSSTSASGLTPTCALNVNSNSEGGCIAESISVSMIALLISFALVGLSYMLGEVFGLESLKGWYKNELKETMKTLMIMIFIFTVLVILGAVAVALAGYPLQQVGSGAALTGNITRAGAEVTNNLGLLYSSVQSGYITPQLSNAYSSMSSLLGVGLGVGLLKGITIFTWTPFPIPPFVPFDSWIQSGSSARVFVSRLIEIGPGAAPGVSLLGDILTLVALPVVSILQIQSDFFSVIIAVSLLVLLPMGILLRAIPLLRGIGGTLIALAIGIAIVYPMLLVGLNMPVTNYMQSTLASSSASYVPDCGGVMGSLICLASDVGAGLNSLTLQVSVGNAYKNTTAFNYGIDAGLNSMNSVYPSLNMITTDVMDQILQLILFILDVIIVVAAVGGIASMMGGKLRTGIGRFKLA